jgi:hypothetical protein
MKPKSTCRRYGGGMKRSAPFAGRCAIFSETKRSRRDFESRERLGALVRSDLVP